MSVLTVPVVPNAINTISELADYPLPVSSFSDTFFTLANQSLDSNLQKIAKDYIVHYDYSQAITNASTSKVVMAESRQLLEYIVRYKKESYFEINLKTQYLNHIKRIKLSFVN